MPLTAAAQGAAIEAHAVPGIVIGAKGGALSGAPLNDFGLSYAFEIELGYLLPLPSPLSHAFELFVSSGYSAPRLSDQTAADPRLPDGGAAHFEIRQRLLSLGGGLLARVPLPSRTLAPYLALGYRGLFIDSQVRGQAGGHGFGEYREQGFVHGLYGAIGLDLFLGPGAILGELQLSYAKRDAYVLRDTNLGALQVLLGYRLILGGPASHARTAAVATPNKPVTKPAPPKPTTAEPSPAPPPEAPTPPAAADATAPDTGPAADKGQIRGNVRSYSGHPLKATVTVLPGNLRTKTGSDGKFSVDVTPGHYTVELHAHGYRNQTRDVLVDQAGITVLNVELGKN